jgi:hypothetical protein
MKRANKTIHGHKHGRENENEMLASLPMQIFEVILIEILIPL